MPPEQWLGAYHAMKVWVGSKRGGGGVKLAYKGRAESRWKGKGRAARLATYLGVCIWPMA